MTSYSDAATDFANRNYSLLSDAWQPAAFGFDSGYKAALAAQPTPAESIVCRDYPNCSREHAGGAGGVPVHPPVGARISGDEPIPALTTVAPAPTPHTITTAAELDALPAGSVVLTSGVRYHDAYQKSEVDSSWFTGGDAVACPSERVPLPATLLVPANAAPEPVRLTDPDDPRIKPGAVVEIRRRFNVVADTHAPADRDNRSVSSVRQGVQCGGTLGVFGSGCETFLLAEAPDPDAEKRQALADLFHDELGVDLSDSDMSSLFRSISHLGYDVVKRGL